MKSRITVANLERVLLLQLFTILQFSCDRKVFRSLSLLNLSYSGVVSAQLRGGGQGGGGRVAQSDIIFPLRQTLNSATYAKP